VRIAWALWVHPDPTDGRFDDTAWYRIAAHYFANGDGYVNPFTGTPTAAWPPGYPVSLGTLFSAFGEGLVQTYGANIALAGLTVAVTYAIGLRLFDRRTATVAAAAMAVWPGQVYFASLTLSEPLFTLLFAFAFLLMVLVPDAGRWRRPLIMLFGAATAAATLTRGQALLLLPLALLAWGMAGYRWRPAIAWVMLAAFVTGVLIAPWVVRNQHQLGSPVLIATNFGPNLWIGNHAGASGRMRIAEAEPPQPERGALTQPEFEVKADRLALRKGLAYMFTHPTAELQLAGTKVRAMYESDATALDWNAGYQRGFYASESTEESLRGMANAFWFGALACAGIGLLASRARLTDLAGILPVTVLLWTATHLLFFGDARFHYPVVFAIALLGARGAVFAFEALRRPERNLGEEYAAA
jgi:4-amino-4-deoxy-L-arabinose transferase-like glycosyltransferase